MARPKLFPGQTVLFGFNSRTAKDWYIGDDGSSGPSSPSFVSLVNADFQNPATVPTLGASCTGVHATFTGIAASIGPNTTFHRAINVVNSGVSGNTIENVLADMTNRIFGHKPDVIICLGWVNNVDGVVQAWDPVAFTANFQSWVDQVLAALPLVTLIVTDSICTGESYTASPPTMGPNVGNHDPDIEAQTVIMQTILAAAGQYFVPIRPLLVQWEIANNPNNDSSGHFLKPTDGLHFSQLGARQLGAWVYAAVQTVP